MTDAARDLRADDEPLRDLWIDGRVYRVPPEVAAHFKFLSRALSNVAESASRMAARIGELERQEREGRA